jgi:hypothetical protein
VLAAAFEIEENFDLLVGNYLELEQSALNIAAEAVAKRHQDYTDIFSIRADVNRRVINFLSTARLYLDQLPQKTKRCGCDFSNIKNMINTHYDSRFEYRFMEGLRNHVQHSGTAVHRFTLQSRWIPPDQREREEYSYSVFAERGFLEQDQAFKKSLLKECPERIDLLMATRVYLEALGTVQLAVRDHVAEPVAIARRRTEEAIMLYEEFSGTSSRGLCAFYRSENEESFVPIIVEWDDVRHKLALRTSSFANLSVRYVTSRPQDV